MRQKDSTGTLTSVKLNVRAGQIQVWIREGSQSQSWKVIVMGTSGSWVRDRVVVTIRFQLRECIRVRVRSMVRFRVRVSVWVCVKVMVRIGSWSGSCSKSGSRSKVSVKVRVKVNVKDSVKFGVREMTGYGLKSG